MVFMTSKLGKELLVSKNHCKFGYKFRADGSAQNAEQIPYNFYLFIYFNIWT